MKLKVTHACQSGSAPRRSKTYIYHAEMKFVWPFVVNHLQVFPQTAEKESINPFKAIHHLVPVARKKEGFH